MTNRSIHDERAPLFPEPLHVGRPNIGDRAAFHKQVDEIFERKWLTNNGQCVQELERRLCERLNVKHCIPVSNGTAGLEVAMKALDLSGEIILPSFTFIATAHMVQWLGLKPVFCDIDPVTLNMDPEQAERLVTEKTSALLGVHLYGRPCDVQGLQAVCDRHGLRLLFDAAHAVSCSHGGKMIGNFGACEVFSFHATKVFNTLEGGAVATNDDALAERIRKMINFGFAGMDEVVELGINAKMNEISAAMGLVNLDALNDFIDINRRNYLQYQAELTTIPGLKLIPFNMEEKNNFQYVVMRVLPDYPLSRDELLERLHRENVRARRYFWPGCHQMEPYHTLQPSAGKRLLITESISSELIVLPTGQSMNPSDIQAFLDLCRFP